jgi:FlgD Ig-like domain
MATPRRHLAWYTAGALCLCVEVASAGLYYETPVPSAGARARLDRAAIAPLAATERATRKAAKEPFATSPLLNLGVEGFHFDTNFLLNDGLTFIPPDAGCAAGPDHVLNIGNSILEWRPKEETSSTPEFQASLKSFFAALPAPAPNPGPGTTLGTHCFDPKVIYDQYAGRFIVVALERWDTATGNPSNQSRILLAVSKTSDPNDGFWFHAIDSKLDVAGADSWADFPGLAVDDKVVYITNNMFQFGAANVYQGMRLWIISKTFIMSGPNNSISFIVRNPYATAGAVTTTMPAHMFGPVPAGSGGRPMGTFLVAYSGITDGDDEYVQIVEVTDPLQSAGGPFFTVQQLLVGDIEEPILALPNAQQQGSSFQIETNDRRVLNAVWRDDNLYCTATIRGQAGSPDAIQATSRWWRLDTTNTTALTQADAGNVSGEEIATGAHTFCSQVMVDGDGNMAIGFAASASSKYCGAYYATRLAGDPPGLIEAPAVLARGVDAYKRYFNGSSNRWGDQSGMALCPNGEADFWVYNQYAGQRGSPGTGSQGVEDGRWRTRLGRFRVGYPTPVQNPLARTLLLQNVPNPFNPITTIRFTLVDRSHATIAVFDIAGRHVRTLVDDTRAAGSHEVTWDGRDARGDAVSSGLYFYRLTTPDFTTSKKMLLLK